MTMPGGWELIVILFIILLLFGAKKLPGLAGSIGESIKEFRKSANEADEGTADETSPSSERDADS
jgi:sec-independent protein translocase protein TatA